MTLPEYTPYLDTKDLQDQPIGNRRLTVFEQGDQYLCGLSDQEVVAMTPKELSELADLLTAQSTILLGC